MSDRVACAATYNPAASIATPTALAAVASARRGRPDPPSFRRKRHTSIPEAAPSITESRPKATKVAEPVIMPPTADTTPASAAHATEQPQATTANLAAGHDERTGHL